MSFKQEHLYLNINNQGICKYVETTEATWPYETYNNSKFTFAGPDYKEKFESEFPNNYLFSKG